VKRAAWWLKSLYELQPKTIQASPRLFCDETPCRARPRATSPPTCQFWAHAIDDRPWGWPIAAGGRAYVFADGRGTRQDRRANGILQVDAIAAYKALARGLAARSSWLFVSRMRDANSSRCTRRCSRRSLANVIERLQASTPSGRDPRQQRRTAACRPQHQDRTLDGGAQDTADGNGRPALSRSRS